VISNDQQLIRTRTSNDKAIVYTDRD